MPTPRWSARICAASKVDCADPGSIGEGLEACCAPEHRAQHPGAGLEFADLGECRVSSQGSSRMQWLIRILRYKPAHFALAGLAGWLLLAPPAEQGELREPVALGSRSHRGTARGLEPPRRGASRTRPS